MVMRAEFDSLINQESLGQSTVNHTDPARSYAEGIVQLRAISSCRQRDLPGAVRNGASAGLSMRPSRIICSQSYTERRLKRKNK